MKRKEVIDFFNVISTLKVSKVKEDVANVILVNTMKVFPHADMLNKVQEQLRKQTLGVIPNERLLKFNEERENLSKLKGEEKAIKDAELTIEYKDILDANNRFIKALNVYLLKDVDITLETVSYKEFLTECNKEDNTISNQDMMILAPMFKDYKIDTLEVSEEYINELLKEID